MSDERKVIAKYLVRGPKRDRFPYYYCAGRGWTDKQVEVEVVEDVSGDAEQDPVKRAESNECYSWVEDKPGDKRRVLSPRRMPAAVFQQVLDNGQMTVRPIDAGADESQKVDVVALVDQNAELQRQIANLKGAAAIAQKKIDELQAMLEEATRPANGNQVMARQQKVKR